MHPIKARRMKGSLCENKEVSHQGSPQNSAQVSAKQAEVGAAQPAGHRRCASLTPFLRKAACFHLVSPPLRSFCTRTLPATPPCSTQARSSPPVRTFQHNGNPNEPFGEHRQNHPILSHLNPCSVRHQDENSSKPVG